MSKLTASLKGNIAFLNIIIGALIIFLAFVVINQIVTGNIIGALVSLIIIGGVYYASRK